MLEDISGLTPEQQALLTLRLKKRAGARKSRDERQAPALRPVPREPRMPVSFAQQRLWFHEQFSPGTSAYNIPFAIRLEGEFDARALEEALGEIVRRHEILRTTFAFVDGRPVQVISHALTLTMPVVDLSGLGAEAREAELRRLSTADARRTFDLTRGPLLRVTLLRLGAAEHVVLFAMHHIVSDGWSIGILIRELAELYRSREEGRPAQLPELPVQYADFADWQRRWMRGEVLAAELAYWKRQLEGAPLLLELPTDRPRPAAQSFRGAQRPFTLPARLSDALKALTNAEGATTFMTLLAAFQTLLYRYTGQEDVSVGTVVAGRNHLGLENLIGFFLNSIVLRTDLSGGPTFRELLRRVRATTLEGYARQDVPFEKLVEELQPERNLGYNALFQVMLIVQNTPAEGLQLPGLRMTPITTEFGTSKLDLTLTLEETPSGLVASLEYSTDLFDDETITRLLRHFETLLESIVADPDRPVQDLPILDEAERRQILKEWNDTRADYGHAPLHRLFERQAAVSPDAVALVFEDESLTYRELNERANRLAHHLRSLGVGTGSVVAVTAERSVGMVISLLAVMKAGAAYLPLDPSYPAQRLAFMLADAAPTVLLTQRRLRDSVGVPADVVVLAVDDEGDFSRHPSENPRVEVGLDDLAYVIYTSGSTGTPKGVMVSHRAISNRLLWMIETFRFDSSERVLQKTSASFDASVWELFVPLFVGGRLVLARPGGERDSAYLVEAVKEHQITTLQLVPSMLQVVVGEEGFADCRSLRRVFCGGEALGADLRDRFHALLSAELHNLYGPTEAAIDATHWACGRGEQGGVPIGRPIGNDRVYVLDGGLRPVPVGVAGELYIGGIGLARGYMGRPSLTAERFVPDPLSEVGGGRLYRTGDVARWRGDGAVEYLGRGDEQVKVRGYRIELGEIEAALRAHEGVQEAAVIAREEAGGHKRLVAFVATADGVREVKSAELRSYLEQRLPEYMVPGIYVALERLPLTANGKLNRRALSEMKPEVSAPQPEEAKESRALNEVEETLARIWCEVLGLERVGIHDNLFELGGDSILSLQISALAIKSGIRATARKIFQYPTIAELAAAVANAPASASAVKQEQAGGLFPLTPIQQDFFERGFAEPHHYNQSLLLKVPNDLTPSILTTLCESLLRRHDALRLRFKQTDGRWLPTVADSLSPSPHAVIDLSGLPAAMHARHIESASASAQASFDLTEGPLLRVLLFETGEEANRLLIAIHHLAVDGVSWRILLEDLQTAYRDLRAGRPAELPSPTTSFARWAALLSAHVAAGAFTEETGYWLTQASAPSAALPVRETDSAPLLSSAQSFSLSLTEEETSALLQEVPRAYNTQINDVLLAALALAVSDKTNARRVRLDLEGHGREELIEGADLSRTVGWFTSVYPVLLDVSGAGDEAAALKAVKEQLRAVPNRGVGYGLLKYLSPDTETRERLRQAPPSQISFNYLGQFDRVLSGGEGFGAAQESAGRSQSEQTRLMHALDINSNVSGGRLHVEWSFSPAQLDEGFVRELMDGYGAALRGLIAHCAGRGRRGHTPSDFPLARISQEELERLEDTGGEVEDLYALSPLQEGLLFHTLNSPGSGVYVQQMSCRFGEGFDVDAFKRSYTAAVGHHAILRSGYVWEGLEEPAVVVRRSAELEVGEEDWRGKSEEEREQRLEKYLSEDRARGFDVTRGPLMRLWLMREADELYRFVWSFQHLILDGWSVGLLIKEVFENYEAFSRGLDAPAGEARPYREYIRWLGRQDMAKAEAFWRGRLRGFHAPTPIGIAPSSTVEALQTGHAEQAIQLPPSLREFARRQQLTLNTVVQGAWALLLSRYAGARDVLFGAVVSGRPAQLPGAESMVGLFINTLPVRVKVGAEERVGEWLQRLQREQAETRQYEYSPLVRVQGWSEVPRGVPLFESILVFENFPALDSSVREQGMALEVSDVRALEQTNYPLTILASSDAEASLSMRYDRGRFDDETIARMLGHFETLFGAFAADPTRRLSDLPVLTPQEEQRILFEWNDTAVAYRDERGVHRPFEKRAAETPDAVALVFEGESLTYRELNERANRLARHLRTLGVGAESVVGVLMERSVEMVVSLLATLKAGAAYLPLEPTYPRQRLSFMLEDARPKVLLTQRRLRELLDVPEGVNVFAVDEEAPKLSRRSSNNPRVKVDADSVAYVIYTSGSTGTPKGVMVTHRAISNRLLWMQDEYRLDSSDVVLQKTPFGFDVSVWEFFWPLREGARLVVVRPGGHQDVGYLAEVIRTEGVTTLHFVPSMLQLFLEGAGLEGCRGVRRVMSSGEALSAGLARRFYERMGGTLHNLYGPTEATVDVTFWECEPGQDYGGGVPIGRPIANIEMYVLDANLRPVPVGVAGELYIGGVGLARGYMGRPSLTAERFVPHPYSMEPGARLYRTGDVGRHRADGAIEYSGRADFQVKIRGNRVELGEIEATLLRHESVREAVVVVWSGRDGEQHLVAYIVLTPGHEPTVAELRAFMKERLPDYMLPQSFVTLDALPLSPNGKVARDRLPAVERGADVATGGEYVAPTNPTELQLVQLWEELFDRRPIGIRDDFFDLGGHSILALRLMARVQKRFGRELPLATLFAGPTVERLARVVGEREGEGVYSPLVPIQPAGGRPPFFCVHPSGGNVLCYVGLSRHLGAGQPFYGLQDPPDFSGSRETIDNVEEMAARYVEVLREVQPAGPYYFGGYSFGGLVAFEMARQLRERQQEVALVALIDTAVPQSATKLYKLQDLLGIDDGLMLAVEVNEQARQAGITLRVSLAELWRLPPAERVTNAFEQGKAAGLWPPEIGLDDVRHYLRLHKARRRAVETYEPRPFDGRLVLLRTSLQTPDNLGELEGVLDAALLARMREEEEAVFRLPSLGWEEYAAQPIEVRHVEGDHHSMLAEPHVRVLAATLRACIGETGR